MKRILQILSVLLFASCIRKGPELPPDTGSYDPGLPVTHSIRSLLALNEPYHFGTGGDTTLIGYDITVAGIVTANDASGNFFRQIVIQDSTAALMVLIGGYSLYNDYPLGRRVYIKCKGLYLGYDGGLPVLGSKVTAQMSIDPIPGTRIHAHIIKGSTGHHIAPDTMDLTEAEAHKDHTDYYCKLITIRYAQFQEQDLNRNFSQPNAATSRVLKNCDGAKLAVRTSNFADFASHPLPAGAGSVTGIYTVYKSASSTPQLLLRSVDDIQFHEARCHTALISIDSVRRLYKGEPVRLGPLRIRGTVISDAAGGNISNGLVVLQDGDKGITVYFGGTIPYKMGDSIELDVAGDTLKDYNGSLEIEIPFGTEKPAPVANGRTVVPRICTIQQLGTLLSGSPDTSIESTVVRIIGASVSGGTSYGGSRNLSDGTGTMLLYTSANASFAGVPLPAGIKTWTGFAKRFGDKNELMIRNLNDVK